MIRQPTADDRGLVVLAVVVLSILVAAALVPGAASATDESNRTDVQDAYTVYQGERVGANLSDAVDAYDEPAADLDVQLRTGDEDDSTFVSRPDVDGETLVLETIDLEPGEHFLRIEGDDWVGDDAPDGVEPYAFEVVVQDLAVDFADDAVPADGTQRLTVDSDRPAFDLVVSSADLTAEDLEALFGDAATDVDEDDDSVTLGDVDERLTADFADVDPGSYEFAFAVADTPASDAATVAVSDERPSRHFAGGPFVDERGDVVEIPVSLADTNRGAVVLGDLEGSGYRSVVEFASLADHEEITLRYDSHVAGTTAQNETSNDGWSVVEDDVAIYGETAPPDGGLADEPLNPYEYDLTLGDRVVDGDLGWTNDETTLTIEPRGAPADFSVATAPAADDVVGYEDLEAATITDGDYVARDDHLLVRGTDAVAGGILEGLDATDGDDVADELADAGIYLEIEEASGPPIGEPTVLNSSEDFGLTAANVERTQGDLVATIDYEAADLAFYEEYTVRLVITDEYAYADERVALEAALRLEERDVEWDDSASTLETTGNATVRGWTNVAPGTTVVTEIRTDGALASTPAAVAVDDGGYRYFEPTFDASSRADGAGYEATARDDHDGSVAASIEGTFAGVVDDDGQSSDGSPDEDGRSDADGWESTDEDGDSTGGNSTNETDDDSTGGNSTDDPDDGMPGFGVALGLIALLAVLGASLPGPRRDG